MWTVLLYGRLILSVMLAGWSDVFLRIAYGYGVFLWFLGGAGGGWMELLADFGGRS